MKLCKTCKQDKPFDCFYKNKNMKDGLWPECKECNILRTRKWQKENPTARKRLKREFWHRHRRKNIIILRKNYDRRDYGGNREKAIQRDREKCVDCGMTRDQHYFLWNVDITVDHENRNRKDNSLENLKTRCLRCHGKKDNRHT